MNDIKIFDNTDLGFKVRTISNEDGSISINAEDAAIGFGWTQVKAGRVYPKWERINGFCRELGFSPQVGKDDYIPEALFYRLGMKASNERAERFQNWLAFDVIPSIRKNGSYVTQTKDQKGNSSSERLRVMEMNARTRMANTYLKLSSVNTLSKEYKNILVAKASEVLAGEALLPLPKQEKKTYSAGDIGKMFNVSGNKIGRIANEHHLKIDEYGEFYRDKSRSSNKEVDSWRYFESVIPVFEDIFRE